MGPAHRGVATEATVQYLKRHGYRYLVVSRQRERIFDPEEHQVTELQNGLQVYGVEADGEQRVYCRRRSAKEKAILKRRRDTFEKQLQKLHDGLSTPRTWKRLDLIWERLQRLKAQSQGVAQQYDIDVVPDEAARRAVKITWKYVPRPFTMATHPGVYCLRTNIMDVKADALWRTYVMLRKWSWCSAP